VILVLAWPVLVLKNRWSWSCNLVVLLYHCLNPPYSIGVGEGWQPSLPLGSYSGESETNPGKFENIRANLKRKNFPNPEWCTKRPCYATDIFWKTAVKVVEDLFLEITLYIWENSRKKFLSIWANFFCPPKLFCSPMVMPYSLIFFYWAIVRACFEA